MGGSDHISSGVMISTDFIFFKCFWFFFGYVLCFFFVRCYTTFCLVSCIFLGLFGHVPLGTQLIPTNSELNLTDSTYYTSTVTL